MKMGAREELLFCFFSFRGMQKIVSNFVSIYTDGISFAIFPHVRVPHLSRTIDDLTSTMRFTTKPHPE